MGTYGTENPKRSESLCHRIFKDTCNRQVTALMFHDSMADFFDFLGLMGFKRMHEYQHFVESAEHRATKRYFINHHNALIMENEGISAIEVIPETWYKYSRFEVTPQVRKQAVETAFEKYRDWELETKECYERYAKELIDAGNMADYDKINNLLQDVDMELKCLDRLVICLKSVGYNEVYVASIQDELHEKYREMTKSIGIDIC